MSTTPSSPADDLVNCPRCLLSFPASASPPRDRTSPAPGPGTVTILPAEAAPEAITPPSPTPTNPPARIGRFEITRYLGEGAFGRVYEAHDPLLKRTVALKVAKPEQLVGERRVARFQREARAAANLLHPNIVAVFDSGEDGGQHYIASAFIPGRALSVVLEELPDGQMLPLRDAVQIVRKLAEALAYAHRQGVVHRDVKAGNVMVREDGEPLLMDFGLAARLDETEKLTVAGQFMGTPEYTAPEQWRGQAEAASDQYSLGCLLFELLTGERPFAGGSSQHYLMLHTQMPAPSPRKLRPDLPRDLETVCLKCLEKEPGRRYPDCQGFADDLRRWLEDEPIVARRVGMGERMVRWARRRPAAAGLLAVIVVALTSLVTGWAWFTWKLEREQAQTKKALRDAEDEADKATKAREFLVSIFRKAETDVKGGNVTVRQLLDEAESRIPVEFAQQPDLRGELVSALGNVKRGIARRTPQAMILQVRGTVRLQSAAGVKKKAEPQALVNLDDRLSLSSDAQVQLVFLSDLHKEWPKPSGEVTIDYKGCQPADAVRRRDKSLLMTFVRLPKGTFYMGGGGGKAGEKTEIKEDFEIAVHDVTQGQWQAVMGHNPSHFSRTGNGRNSILDVSDEELKLFPVESVSWDDAQAFLKKLNEREKGRGFLYRLPTEAEWEYACRGGTTSEEECSYHFYLARPTNDLSSEQANFNGTYPAGKAPKGKHLQRTTRVGAYPPNKLGLCDMHGNVWQWTSTAEGSDRVGRGGGWINYGFVCRAAVRLGDAPRARSLILGFRLARVPVR
jgi:formylglycine-generating enzyme required for sulfatase activity/tRNA A-37 threonylcarbamoyl transferase component Bud32